MRISIIIILSILYSTVSGQTIERILYRGDSIYVYPTDSITMTDIKLIDSLSDGKYYGFFKGDTAFLRLEINYLNNRIEGKVIEYYYANRNVDKITNYKNGLKHGYWAEYDYFEDYKEILHEGHYENDLEQGFQYSYTGDAGDRWVYNKSFYKNDTLIYNIWQGRDSTYYQNDTGFVYQHDWKENLIGHGKELKNKKVGYWEYYHPNGKIKSKGEYTIIKKSNCYNDSRKHGKWIDYHPNGKISRDYICDSKKKGTWISSILCQYDSLGNILDANNFIDGIGLLKDFYPNGIIHREAFYVSSDFVSYENYYKTNGTISSKEEFTANQKTRTEYYVNGRIKSIERFTYFPSDNEIPLLYYRFGKQEYFNSDGTIKRIDDIKEMQLDE